MRKQADLLFQVVSLATLVIALGALAALVFDLLSDGASRLSWQFLTNIASRNADEAGVYHALMGSIWVIALTGLLALPIGVAAATPIGSDRAAVSRMTQMLPISA